MPEAAFERALVCAAQLHRDQRRKGSGVPYVAHLLGACSIALEHGADEEEAVAALLHDAVEDQGGDQTWQMIREAFGARVAEIVAGCTDTDQQPKPPWRERKEAYLAHLPGASASVRLVSASDKLHNLRSIVVDYRELGEALWARFRGGREGTVWYYRSLVEVFDRAGPAALAAELGRMLAELERLLDPDPGAG